MTDQQKHQDMALNFCLDRINVNYAKALKHLMSMTYEVGTERSDSGAGNDIPKSVSWELMEDLCGMAEVQNS